MSNTALLSFKAKPTLYHRHLLFKIRYRYRKHDDDRGYKLEHECRHIEAQRDGVHQPEQYRAEHNADGAGEDAALPHDNTAYEQRGQRDGDHAGSDVYIDGLLRLSQKTAGQRREGACDAQADYGRERGVYR